MAVATRPNPSAIHPVRVTIAMGVMACVLAGCGDGADPTGPAYRPLPVIPSALRSEMVATVDLKAGTLTFGPTIGGFNSASGVSAAIYGNQNVTVRLYNTPVVISPSATAGKKLYSAMVGVKNLLAYPIGDEQGGAAPTDTIGIDVFVVNEPSVRGTSSACAPACTVTVRDHHGVRAFSAPNQKFWHWNDRLSAVGAGSDTTLTRASFTFEADTQVTNFSFTVVLNAPWPAPYETRHKVDYQGDSLPTANGGTRWRLIQTGSASAPVLSNGLLSLDPKSGELSYYRLDSLATTNDAYIEARIKWNGTTSQGASTAEPRITLVDGAKLISVGVFSSSVGFVTASGALVGTRYDVATTAYHVYQLRKYAADSAVFYVDGMRGGKVAYASLPASQFGAQSRIQFGATNAIKPTTSTWDYVTYEIGAATP